MDTNIDVNNTFTSDIDLINKNNQSKVLDVDISDIDSYKFNPRQSINPNYSNIKSSIKAVGLLQLFTVSLNPKTSRYMPIQGGNTRLKIIKELFKQTGDIKYQTIECIVVPWDDSIDDNIIQIKHLIENEKRGDLNLTDKSRCIVEIETQYKNYNQDQDKTTKGFLQYLSDKGFLLSENLLGICRFVNYHLEPLEFHLNKDFSISNVKKIRAVYNNLKKRVFKDLYMGDVDIDELFHQSMKNYTSKKDFKFDNLIDAMIWSLLDSEELLKNTYTYLELKKELLFVAKKDKTIVDDNKKIPDNDANNPPIPPLDVNDEKLTDLTDVSSPPSQDENNNNQDINDGSDWDNKDNNNQIDQITNYQLATSIAKIFDLENLIIDIGNLGYGFLLVDTPKNGDFNQWMMFWWLLSLSGVIDIKNLIIDNKVLDNIDVKADILKRIYNNQENEDIILNEIYNIQGTEEKAPEPYPNFLLTFKQELEPTTWQHLSTLEFAIYQRNKQQENTSIWEISNG